MTGTPLIASMQRTKSVEALTMDTRLDKLSEWVKGVERESLLLLSHSITPPHTSLYDILYTWCCA